MQSNYPDNLQTHDVGNRDDGDLILNLANRTWSFSVWHDDELDYIRTHGQPNDYINYIPASQLDQREFMLVQNPTGNGLTVVEMNGPFEMNYPVAPNGVNIVTPEQSDDESNMNGGKRRKRRYLKRSKKRSTGRKIKRSVKRSLKRKTNRKDKRRKTRKGRRL